MRMALAPLLGLRAPYAAFFLAVAGAAVFGNTAAGAVAIVLSSLAAIYFLIPPLYILAIKSGDNLSALLVFLLVSSALLALIDIQRRQKARASAEAIRLREAENSERSLRERFEVTLASIGDGVISTDAQSRITFMNEVASSLTGWTIADASGKPLDRFFNKRIEETGPVMISRDGRERPISETSAPIRDAGGNLLGSVLVFRDISAIRERDAAVQRAERESEIQFRTLADSIPQLAWIAHADGHIFWYNRRWYAYTGSTPEQMEGWGWQSVHDPVELPRVLKEWMSSIETGAVFDGIVRLRGEDGVLRPFLTLVMPLRDEQGKVVRWFGTNTDITERQKIVDRLRASDERFRRLYDSDVVGIVCMNSEKIFEANDLFLKMLGYSREDLVAGRLRWRDLTAAEHREGYERVFEKVLSAGSCKPFEKELIHRDGRRVPILVGATLLDGDPAQCLCLVVDLTERKRLERKVLEAQKLDSVGLLAGGVAHDFNNMLVGVIGSASLAMGLVPPGGEAAELLDNVIRTGEQLAHLTRQMLAYAGKGRFVIEPLDLSEMAKEMIKLLQTSIPRKIALQTEWAADLPPTEADRGQMHQIITNLVLNAAEAIGRNIGVISVSTGVRDLDDRSIREDLDGPDIQTGSYVYLQVRDDGCGMEKETKTQIFDPFFSTKFVGRGLGLAAVAGIVRSHKGAISVNSAPGAGACFTVFLPAAQSLAPAPSSAPSNDALRGTGTILVVDDEELVRSVAQRTLERCGYKVLLAESGAVAVDLFRRHPDSIAAVVLDLSMPSMGGNEALPELRGIRPEVKFVISSGHSEIETMALFAGQRVAGFLQKPYTPAVLAEAVAKALR
jgi:PAS domain S-box-containing protein